MPLMTPLTKIHSAERFLQKSSAYVDVHSVIAGLTFPVIAGLTRNLLLFVISGNGTPKNHTDYQLLTNLRVPA